MESTAILFVDRATDDVKILSDITQLLSIRLPSNIELHRLDRYNNKNPWPVKTLLSSKEKALQFINDFNVGKPTHVATDRAISISITRDRTILERHEIRRVHA